MTLAILTSKNYQKEDWKERLCKIVKEKTKSYKPEKILVNHWYDCINKVESSVEILNSLNVAESSLVMIIRCSQTVDDDLENLVKDFDLEKLSIKNYKI